MNEKFALKCAEIRLCLHEIDRTIERIQTGPITMTDGARDHAEGRMGSIGDLIAASLKDVVAAQSRAEAWVGHGRPLASARIAGWKADGRIHDLNERADDTEAYALAILELAAAAARECAHAILEAVLARSDADAACLPPAAPAVSRIPTPSSREASR